MLISFVGKFFGVLQFRFLLILTITFAILAVFFFIKKPFLLNEVKAEDVAKAFFHLAVSKKTTGAVLTVDGGNIAASLR